MISFIKYIWQLPQHIIAILYYIYLEFNDCLIMFEEKEDYTVYTKISSGSVTLGQYIFASPRATEKTIKHESGHVKQSLMLGPLYLIVIGIPSILWACTHRWIAPKKEYEWFFCEKWADKLGGVTQ